MVAEELPGVIVARLAERWQNGESAAEVSAWLADLGYRVSAAAVERIASQYWQRGDAHP